MVSPVEFRFKIQAYSKRTFPLDRLADYLHDLAVMLGQRKNVHLDRLDDGSAEPVLLVDWEAVPKLKSRANEIRNNEGPQDARDARDSINRRLAEDNGSADLVDDQGSRVLWFPGRQRHPEPEYGPFNQPGTLDGVPQVIGGEGDPVSVHLKHDKGVYVCRASRIVAKRMSTCLFTTPVRAIGVGRWFRDSTGKWDLRKFTIQDFSVLKDESLVDAVERMQQIPGKWKETEDPIGDLIALREREQA